jgi:uncharacterized protein (TIGR02646 family)
MKHIVKGPEPKEYIEWKAKACDDWQPTYNDLSGNVKDAVKKALMEEQGHICCYCERRLSIDDSHIEHFRPQSEPAVDPLDYSNMLCSCQHRLKKGEPRHCGNLKDHWFDDRLLISPFESHCESRFAFSADGRIRPSRDGDVAAETTITKLGLGIPKLNALREKAIEPFLDESLEPDELARFILGYLEPATSGYLGEFWTTINFLFGAMGIR